MPRLSLGCLPLPSLRSYRSIPRLSLGCLPLPSINLRCPRRTREELIGIRTGSKEAYFTGISAAAPPINARFSPQVTREELIGILTEFGDPDDHIAMARVADAIVLARSTPEGLPTTTREFASCAPPQCLGFGV